MGKDFFNRNAEIVARELLGKTLVRKTKSKELRAMIVETEAYFDESDPASRARQNGDLKDTMKMEAGTILVYCVHNNWLINFVVNEEGIANAVLIRSIEPLNFNKKCDGPGLLTKSLKINKIFHKRNILNDKEIWIENIADETFANFEDNKANGSSSSVSEKLSTTNKPNNIFEIVESFRIGVKKDLPKKLRFYIKDNKFVGKK